MTRTRTVAQEAADLDAALTGWRATFRRWAVVWVPGVCKHPRTRCLHGDEILARMSPWRGIVRRQACIDCGRTLDRDLPDVCTSTGTLHNPPPTEPVRHPLPKIGTYIGVCCREWVLAVGVPVSSCGLCGSRPVYERDDDGTDPTPPGPVSDDMFLVLHRIADATASHHWDPADLARHAALSETAVRRILAADRPMSAGELALIADALGVRVPHLLTGEQ